MTKMNTKLIKVIKRTQDVKSFRCQRISDVDFLAGQYMSVTLKVGDEEQTKYFSFSNSPTEKGYYEFTKKITDSAFSKTLDILKPEDSIKLELPKGSFTLNEDDKKITFLSGGIGITPLRSMIKYIIDQNLDIDMNLIYGNHTEDNIVFIEDLDIFSKNNQNFRAVYTLDSLEKNQNAWHGRTGIITSDMIKEVVSDFHERKFYICGPPKMVKSLKKILTDELNIQKDQINTENFGGY